MFNHMAFFSKAKSGKQTHSATASATPVSASAQNLDVVAQRSVIEHRDFLLGQVPSGKPFGIGLLDVDGLTLCESLYSDIDLPVFTAATVDGWAVRASNLVGASPNRPIGLPVVDSITAAVLPVEPLIPGTAVRVVPGAPVPEGADAVVALSDGEEVEGGVNFFTEVPFHKNLIQAGSRIGDGAPLLPAGTVLNPRLIAMLAEVGHDKVLALPKPRVVIGAVGADLLDPGKPLTQLAQHYDATTAMLTSAVRTAGGHAYPIGIMPSNARELAATLREQILVADLILLVAQDTPELRMVLSKLGEIDRAEVAISPAGTSLFARIGEQKTPVLVLPANVVSAYVSYEVFALPLVRKLAGSDPLERESVAVASSQGIHADPQRTQFVLATQTPRGVTPVKIGEHAGGVELAQANALIVLAPGLEVAFGQNALCWLLDQ
ncbi:MAG: molybdopterin molybdotransferase MoeA [Propionibacteriaceae bacterium]|jgi:molybdopterin molybdotransferase|nr:molybdopterin molybdotransferase MoeA [Propionibacteriaceae bacterium]